MIVCGSFIGDPPAPVPAPAQPREEAAGAAGMGACSWKRGPPATACSSGGSRAWGHRLSPCIFTAAPASLVVTGKGERRPLLLDV